jgi:bacterioferritin
MKGDEKVIEYLNAALRSELTAINQYWVHYRLQEDWGVGHLAAKSRTESIEEMHHADKLIERIIFLAGHPNLQKLDPLRIGQSPKETLDCDLAAEHDARALYIEARDHCDSVGDYVSKNLFEELIADEEGHIDFLETQLDLFEKLGAERYAQLNASKADSGSES